MEDKTRDSENIIAKLIIEPHQNDVKLDSIGGSDKIKQGLFELTTVLLQRRHELFSHRKLLNGSKGVLLHGPPGTGKTMLAKAIAKECGAVLINVRLEVLQSNLFEDLENFVEALFSLGYKRQPAIIFIDEIDRFLGTDHISSRLATKMKNELMAKLDGLSTDEDAQVVVFAATSWTSDLDKTVLWRLPYTFEIGLPNLKERTAILKVILKDEAVDDRIDYNYLATLCEGYSGADILELCKKAAYVSLSEWLYKEKNAVESSELRPFQQSDFEEVIALSGKKKTSRHLDKNVNAFEDIITKNIIKPNQIDVNFDSIGGLENIKQGLIELITLRLQRPELFSRGKLLRQPKGILLSGPPGTGKTMLAKAIAKECEAVFIKVKLTTTESVKFVEALFNLAYKLQPAIIFIDEADRFFGQSHSTNIESVTKLRKEFMSQWDGITADKNAFVVVLAATSLKYNLDREALRHLPHAFEVGLPSVSERAAILKVILKDEELEENFDYDNVARMCEGYSGSDISDLCNKASYIPLREVLVKEKYGEESVALRPLSQSDLGIVLAMPKRRENRFVEVIYKLFKKPSQIDVQFDSIGGLEMIKRSLEESIILPLKRPGLFSSRLLQRRECGALLYGPPGTGKTMLAKAIAKECGAFFIDLKSAVIQSNVSNESSKFVETLFVWAIKLQPSIIFIDEIDSFLARCPDTLTMIKSAFFTLWDLFTAKEDTRILVLGATNHVSHLNEAAMQRLPLRFEIGLPNLKERASILKVILKDEEVGSDIDYDHVASLCNGYSGSDIFQLCKKAVYILVKEMIEKEENGDMYAPMRSLLQSDLEEVLATSRNTKKTENKFDLYL